MKKQQLICQSCSMPITQKSQFGTEADGSLNEDYCIYCYKDGAYTKPQATLQEMIEFYAPQWGSWIGKPDMSLEDAKTDIQKKLSPLKRWNTNTKRRCCCGCKK